MGRFRVSEEMNGDASRRLRKKKRNGERRKY